MEGLPTKREKMIRAFILGFIGIVILSSIAYFNDFVLKQTQLIGNHLPISVFGGMILFLITANALLFKIARRYAFTGREMAVAMALILVTCGIPAGGMMRIFPSMLVYPHHYARTEPGWKENKIIEQTPEKMLVDVGADQQKVLNGMVQGMAIGDKHISLRDIPWHAWKRTLLFWIPFFFVIWIGIIGLSLVVHKQWAHHEQLPYPVAMFANAILPAEGKPFGWLLENRAFWTTTCIVLGIHLINYAYEYFPNSIQIPLHFDFSKIADISETLRLGGLAGRMNITLFLSVIGVAYFIPTEVSFSLAAGPLLWTVVAGIARSRGIELWRGMYGAGGFSLPSPIKLFPFGAVLAMLAVLYYNGRHYYQSVLRKAFRPRAKGDAPPEAVWGARIFLVCALITVLNLMSVGIDLSIAFMLVIATFAIYIIQARVIAETGYYMYTPILGSFIIGIFGVNVIGPKVFIPMFVVMSMLFWGAPTREALMPYFTNSLKVLESKNLRIGRFAGWTLIALAVALAISLPAAVYYQYDRGKAALWPTGHQLPRYTYKGAAMLVERLKAQGTTEEANNTSGIDRFLNMKPDMRSMVGIGMGALLAGLFSFARIRIPGWPLHPVIFLVWHTWGGMMLWGSFMAGFLIKKAITKYGGEQVYQRVKPIMFGLIAGDMLGGIIPAGIGMAYHWITGELPKQFSVTLW